MPSLQSILSTSGFKIGIELVSTRGTTAQEKTKKLIRFGKQLCDQDGVDWISITDNAAGHPAIFPTVIGKSLLSKGKEIIIHMTCKDYNRNGLESNAWEFASEGFSNVLAITGDYPASEIAGTPKPVFDIDSVSLLHSLSQFNKGLEVGNKKKSYLDKTNFYLGAVVSNFKKNENELISQYLKLLKKIEMGASFIINQVGFDAGKMSELISFQKYKKLEHIHMIGNVFVLSKFTVNLFHQNKIHGVVLTDNLYQKCQKTINSSDKGKQFFLELAAKMLAIYKGLGYKGGYLGGIHTIGDYKTIMTLFYSYDNDDWKQFVLEMQYAQHNEFFMFEMDNLSGLTSNKLNDVLLEKGRKTKHVNPNYSISKRFHKLLFTKDKGLYNTGKHLCEKSNSKLNAPKWLYKLEKIGKNVI
jgi:methylenetetrahydrofolate reductase (NADPH)